MADFLINVIVTTRAAEQGVQRVDRSLTAMERSLTRINRLLGAVFAFQAVSSGVQAFTRLADSLTLAENRLVAVGTAANRTATITNELFSIANQSRTSFEGVTEVFQRVSIALAGVGASEQEVIDFTRTLTQTIALSGATTAEAEGALRQFTQGLAANRLSGQELNSVLEQLPFLAGIIADELNVTTGELRGLANQGLITGAVLRSAIANAGPEIARLFANTIPTIAQSFVVLRNRVIEVAGGFLQTSGTANALAQSILSLANNLEVVLRVASAVALTLGTVLAARAIPLVIAGVNALTLAIARNPFGALAVAATAAISTLAAFSDQIKFTNDGIATLADVGVVTFGRLRDGVVTAFRAISDLINQFLPNVDLINTSFEDLARQAAGGLDTLVAVFRAAVVAVEETAKNFGPVLQDAFISGLNGVIGIVEDGINAIIAGLDNLGPALFDIAANAIRSVASIFDIGFSDIVDFVASVPGRIADALTGLFRAGEDAGTSLIDGIDAAIDLGVDRTTGRLTVELARLESPASGAMRDVAAKAGAEFTRTLEQAPVSQALEGVIEDARDRAVLRAADVGTDVGKTLGDSAAVAVLEEQGNLEKALEGLLDAASSFFGLTEQEFRNFSSNLSTILGGADLEGAFRASIQGVANLIGVLGSDLTNALGGAFNVLRELGFELEDVFGRRGAQAVRILGAVTSEQFQGIISVVAGLGSAVVNAIPALVSFFTTMTVGGAAASAALLPITITVLAIAAAVVFLIAIFGGFGDEVQRVARILAVVFFPFIGLILLIVEAVKFLIDVFNDLGDAGNRVAQVLAIVLAPIIIPILAVVEAVKFLIDLFSNLGSVGSTVSTILQVVLAPIIIPIRLIIEAVQFLINLFGNLGGVVQVFGNIFGAVFGVILNVAQAVFSAIQAAGQAVFAFLQGVVRAFGAVATAVFNAIQSVATSVFNAIQAVGSAVVAALRAAFQALGAALGAVFNTILSIGRAAFQALGAAGQAAASAIAGAIQSLVGIAKNVFDTIVDLGKKAFDKLVSIAKKAGGVIGGVIGQIAGGIGGIAQEIAGGIGNIGQRVIGGIGNIGRRVGRGIRRGLRSISPFAEGGVINGPTALAGPDVAGKAFRSGGILSQLTALNASNVTPTSSLGVAGERGPEGILPLTKTSRGLGVSATFDEDLLRSLSANPSFGRETGGTTIVNRIVLISTRSETVEELEEQVLDLNASIEQRVDVRLSDFLSEVA